MFEPFRLKRIGPLGPDSTKHLFCVEAVGNHELVRTKESPPSALINGSLGAHARVPVQRLVDALNAVWAQYLLGTYHDDGAKPAEAPEPIVPFSDEAIKAARERMAEVEAAKSAVSLKTTLASLTPEQIAEVMAAATALRPRTKVEIAGVTFEEEMRDTLVRWGTHTDCLLTKEGKRSWVLAQHEKNGDHIRETEPCPDRRTAVLRGTAFNYFD